MRSFNRVSIRSATVSCLLLMLSSPAALAFTLQADHLRGWATDTLTFKVNYAGCSVSEEALNEAIGEAVDLWNTIPSSAIRLQRGGVSDSAASDFGRQYDNGEFVIQDSPVIFCSTDFAKDARLPASESGEAAAQDFVPGVSGPGITGGQMTYGPIILNSQAGARANISRIPKDKLKIILAHEMGHILGLGHSGDTRALMYYDATAKNTLALSQDDMDGVTFLYPRKEGFGDGLLGCGSMRLSGADRDSRGGRGGNGGTGAGALEWVIFFGMCLLATRMRFRRRLVW